MSIWNTVKEIIKPVTDVIDEVHTSDEERLKIQQTMSEIEYKLAERLLTYEQAMFEAQQKAIQTEAQSESWLARTWRPFTMITFLLIILYQGIIVTIFNLPSVDFSAIPERMWSMLMIGLGGYVVGRSGEKMVKSLKGK